MYLIWYIITCFSKGDNIIFSDKKKTFYHIGKEFSSLLRQFILSLRRQFILFSYETIYFLPLWKEFYSLGREIYSLMREFYSHKRFFLIKKHFCFLKRELLSDISKLISYQHEIDCETTEHKKLQQIQHWLSLAQLSSACFI